MVIRPHLEERWIDQRTTIEGHRTARVEAAAGWDPGRVRRLASQDHRAPAGRRIRDRHHRQQRPLVGRHEQPEVVLENEVPIGPDGTVQIAHSEKEGAAGTYKASVFVKSSDPAVASKAVSVTLELSAPAKEAAQREMELDGLRIDLERRHRLRFWRLDLPGGNDA